MKIMTEKPRTVPVELVVRDGEPVAVILEIGRYRELLERLDEVDDLRALEELRRRPVDLRPLQDFLDEYAPGV
jgi:hypothetical protein